MYIYLQEEFQCIGLFKDYRLILKLNYGDDSHNQTSIFFLSIKSQEICCTARKKYVLNGLQKAALMVINSLMALW